MKRLAPLSAVLCALAALSIMALPASAEEGHGAAPSLDPAGPQAVSHSAYPLDICVVTGEKLGSMGDVVKYDYQGREIRFCCAGCVSKFEADPETYIAKIDAAIIEQQLPLYPLKSSCIAQGCDITPESAQKVVAGNRLLLAGCPGCAGTVEEDPETYIAILDQKAVEAQLGSYPARTCPVTDAELGSMGEPVNLVYGGRLVRFCCAGCIDAFLENPAEYMAKVYK